MTSEIISQAVRDLQKLVYEKDDPGERFFSISVLLYRPRKLDSLKGSESANSLRVLFVSKS